MDRAWYSWQMGDFAKRKHDISGNILWEDYENKCAGNVTLDSPMSAGNLAGGQSIKIGDVMDTKAGPFCYTYDTMY